MKTTLLTLCFSLMCMHFGYSQTTNIPDENFEQALIDLGIDSDGTINGQVLTADIENVTELDLSNEEYYDLGYYDIDITGISGFTSLEILDLQGQPIYWEVEDEAILNSNLNLREIYLNNEAIDFNNTISIERLDLSNLEHLEYVDLSSNNVISSIKLDNPNYDYENLVLDLYHEGGPGGELTNEICIQVNAPNAASNNEAPYNTWTITVNDFVTTYSFASNCNLNTDDFEDLNSISVYPNPVQHQLNFNNPKQVTLDEVKVFNIKGQLVKTFSKVDNQINLVNLDQGVYFVKVKSDKSSETFKILKQ